MTTKERIDILEQRIYELECVLKYYPKPFDIPAWMKPIHYDGVPCNTDGTIDIDWDWEL